LGCELEVARPVGDRRRPEFGGTALNRRQAVRTGETLASGLQIIRLHRTFCTMWINREISTLLMQRARTRPAVVLTGARQTGKTSLVRRCFPDHEFVSLDLPSEAEQAEHDPGGFLTRHPPPLIVDEVQYAPGLFRHLKTAVDANRQAYGQYILTGSQKLTLMTKVSDSLAGRADIVELEGLSWKEIQAAHPNMAIEDALVRGAFPELWAQLDIDREAFYRSYVATYLERDVRQILNVSSLRDYERFLRVCALRSGQLLNKAELSRDVGISASTAQEWLSVLEASNQIVLLQPWFSNRTKSLVKTPKLYLTDTGLCAFLVGVRDTRDLLASPFLGALWETLVCSEIRRTFNNQRGGWSLNFWRDRSREADFLLHHAGRFGIADAKSSEHPNAHDAAALQAVAALLPSGSVDRMAIVCRAKNPYPLSPRVKALPLAAVGELL
jgi:predicted AAA+ superfamily ATPase